MCVGSAIRCVLEKFLNKVAPNSYGLRLALTPSPGQTLKLKVMEVENHKANRSIIETLKEILYQQGVEHEAYRSITQEMDLI